ncbi:MAG: LVIVD repeat-containing protein [Actinomycetes bacterium]
MLRSRLTRLLTAAAMAVGLASSTAALPSVPVLMSDNVELVGAVPEPGIVAVTFDPLKPVAYGTGASGVVTYDVTNPTLPRPLGRLALPHFSNENVKLGVREDGTRLILIGVETFGAGTNGSASTGNGFYVVDVTNPAAPRLASSRTTGSGNRTHTMFCADAGCTVAYNSGTNGFTIWDLTDINAPMRVPVTGINRAGNEDKWTSPVIATTNGTFNGTGHDWDLDGAGVAWLSGAAGITAFDVSDPKAPRILNSSDFRGRSAEFNKYIIHNSQRPDAESFVSRPDDEVYTYEQGMPGQLAGPATPEEVAEAGIRAGEIVFVTEEDITVGQQGRCGKRGGFQAWHVQQLDADVYESTTNPERKPFSGSITAIGKWTTEANYDANDPLTNSNVAALCSAHYFDIHSEQNIAAQAWYNQGIRFLDARDPSDITQLGYYITGGQQAFGAKWVPEYGPDGKQTGRDTNLVYTEDPARGIEILRVELPEEGEDSVPVRAPILREWFVQAAAVSEDDLVPGFGYACRLAG